MYLPGADPGIFVRGNFLKFLTSKKKKKKKKKGGEERKQGFGCSFTSAKLWFKSTFNTIIYIQVFSDIYLH